MKTIILFFATILILGLGNSKRCISQTVAIGHITAEVVESVSVSSQAATSLILDATIVTGSNAAGQSVVTSPTLNLGTMTINSGSNATVNVLLKSATLSDSQGNGFTLDPGVTTNSNSSVAQSNGSQDIKLNGTANLNEAQASGLYQGSYTVIFAYN